MFIFAAEINTFYTMFSRRFLRIKVVKALYAHLTGAVETLEGLGIDVLLVNPENQELLTGMIHMIAAATNTEDKAAQLLDFTAAQEAYLAETSAYRCTLEKIIKGYRAEPEVRMPYGVDILETAMAHSRTLPMYAEAMAERQKARVALLAELKDVDACIMTGDTNAMHFTSADLDAADHPYKLTPRAETIISVNFGTCGTGGATCGPDTLSEYRLYNDGTDYAYTYTVDGELYFIEDGIHGKNESIPKTVTVIYQKKHPERAYIERMTFPTEPVFAVLAGFFALLFLVCGVALIF